MMLVWWAFFFARKVHEVEMGRPENERLVSRPADWYTSLPRQRAHYQERALASFTD
ncbi:hypothetical protein KFU94_33725 [Chloroflexi bacterium TSY]|nr:hypothetical protein [Chloroflexi bacterium TSY]